MIPVSSFSEFASGLGDQYMGRGHEGSDLMGGGVALKQHQLRDMSRPEQRKSNTFDDYLKQFKQFKVGQRLEGVKVNTGYNNKNKPVTIVGRLKSFKIDRGQKTVRVFIYDPTNSQEFEVYADTIRPITESHVKTFDSYIVID